MKNSTALVTVLVLISIKANRMCNINVCLTWNIKNNQVRFICKVNELIYGVMFFDPLNKEQAYCLSPVPSPSCHTVNTKGIISQDRKTNKTIFILQTRANDHINGNWTCTHGHKLDKAVVEVPVLDVFRESEGRTDCWKGYLLWAMMSFCASCFVSYLALDYFCGSDWKILMCKRLYRCMIRRKCVVIATVLAVFVVIIMIPPIALALQERNCTAITGFCIQGLILGVTASRIIRKIKMVGRCSDSLDLDQCIEHTTIPVTFDEKRTEEPNRNAGQGEITGDADRNAGQGEITEKPDRNAGQEEELEESDMKKGQEESEESDGNKGQEEQIPLMDTQRTSTN